MGLKHRRQRRHKMALREDRMRLLDFWIQREFVRRYTEYLELYRPPWYLGGFSMSPDDIIVKANE